MAILRGGTRIFGSDVRIGLSRDKSLENVTNDPRLRQKPGGDRQSTMGRFHSYVSEVFNYQKVITALLQDLIHYITQHHLLVVIKN